VKYNHFIISQDEPMPTTEQKLK